jgi:transposase-like protein
MNNEIVQRCKYCQSEHVIKYGLYKGIQRHFCKDCKRKFVATDTIPKMQYSTSKVSDVLNMYYEGMSLQEIRRNFIQQHGDYMSDVTPYNWVRRFTELATQEAGKYRPKVSGVWIADETVLDIDGKNVWF